MGCFLKKILIVTGAAVFLSCAPTAPEPEGGSITVRLQEPGIAHLLKGHSYALTWLKSSLRRHGRTVSEKTALADQGVFEITYLRLPEGSGYSLYLQAAQSEDVMEARGESEEFSIYDGENTVVSVQLHLFVPQLVSPENGGSFSADQERLLEWETQEAAVSYLLLTASDAGFASNVRVIADLSEPEYTLPFFYGKGTVYWKVSCKDRFGLYGAWSEVRHVTIM